MNYHRQLHVQLPIFESVPRPPGNDEESVLLANDLAPCPTLCIEALLWTGGADMAALLVLVSHGNELVRL